MFFKKEMPRIEESWSVHTGTHNGLPIIVRKNDGVKVIAGQGFLNYRSGISYELINHTENGLQSQDEEITINKIEDEIFNSFNDYKNCIIVIVISTNNLKEYVIFHNNNIGFDKKVKLLQDKLTGYKITTYTNIDKKWVLFAQF